MDRFVLNRTVQPPKLVWKNACKKINGSGLKLYHERKGNCSNVSSQQVLDYRDEDEDIQILTEKCSTLPDDVQNEKRTQKYYTRNSVVV